MRFDDFSQEYQWGQRIEKVFGPFDGYHIALRVQEMGVIGGKFVVAYKVRRGAPNGSWESIQATEQKVAGLFESADEAIELALQLARLQVDAHMGCMARRSVPVSVLPSNW